MGFGVPVDADRTDIVACLKHISNERGLTTD